jgi:hypothetical protein
MQFEVLYGKKAAALYTQAGDYQKTARFYYKKAEDTYYQVSSQFPRCAAMLLLRACIFGVSVNLMCSISSCVLIVLLPQANNWAAYDDWRRARDQWDYFYSRNR